MGFEVLALRINLKRLKNLRLIPPQYSDTQTTSSFGSNQNTQRPDIIIETLDKHLDS